MYFKQFIFRNIIYLAVCFVIIPQLAFATQPVRMLTVTGAAAVKVKPNLAKLTWTIEARADAPASAMAALRSKTASLLAALEAFGLPKEDLASSVLSLSPNFQYIDRQPSKLLDYSAITRLEVTPQAGGGGSGGRRCAVRVIEANGTAHLGDQMSESAW